MIVTYDFNSSDAANYWKQMGVNSDVSRIHKVYTTDNTGGPKPKDNADVTSQEEASLDIEQAGGVADQAQIDAYIGVSGTLSTCSNWDTCPLTSVQKNSWSTRTTSRMTVTTHKTSVRQPNRDRAPKKEALPRHPLRSLIVLLLSSSL